VRVLSAHKKPITCLAFSRSGARLAEAAHGGTVRVWDVAASEVTHTFDVSKGLFPNQVKLALSPDAKWLAAANDRAVLIDLRTGKQSRLPGQQSAFNRVEFSPDGRELIADGDHFFRWDVSARERLPGPALPPVRGGGPFTWPSATFSPDGKRFAVSRRAWGQKPGNVNTAFVVDAKTLKPLAAFDCLGNDTRRLSFSPDGSYLAAASGPVLRVYDVAAGAEVATLTVGKLHFMAAAFSPDGRYLATVSKDRTTRLWEVGRWGEPRTFEWNVGKLLDLAFAPDGSTAAVAGDGGKVVLFDVD
jgi:WD40 repeat protein